MFLPVPPVHHPACVMNLITVTAGIVRKHGGHVLRWFLNKRTHSQCSFRSALPYLRLSGTFKPLAPQKYASSHQDCSVSFTCPDCIISPTHYRRGVMTTDVVSPRQDYADSHQIVLSLNPNSSNLNFLVNIIHIYHDHTVQISLD